MMECSASRKSSRDLFYANKLSLKDFSFKDMRFKNDETTIYTNQSLLFNTRRLWFLAPILVLIPYKAVFLKSLYENVVVVE